ncbi:cyclin-A2 [Anas platyrhynchos]|uniref:Cyclin-A2 n=2 Tax=Anas TaxID=8835 RepID=A0A8B9R3F7_ANAPL|nr:cyclin-A2 [Anas platyrhynchos]|eukprot:XP_005015597.2 cyclin-A2 [Anas platyrhynchos]
MLAEQEPREDQENVPPLPAATAKGPLPPPAAAVAAAARVALGPLRGAQLQAGGGRAPFCGGGELSAAGGGEQGTRRRPPQPQAQQPPQPQPFSVYRDEPDGERRRSGPAAQRRRKEEDEEEDEEAALGAGLRAAVGALGERRPLAPLGNAMELSCDSPSIMDISITSEAEEKKTNVNNVPDYITDIHTYLREMEVKCKPKIGYMKKQPDITNNMRAILVDWLVEVGEEYKLQNETLHLAVNYIDRFLSSMSVLRGKLQLVGTAAMLLASKFEEIYPPEVAEFVYITDDTYNKKQVLRMEHLILKVLSFDLAAPTINQFLTQYFLHQQTNAKVESLSMYLGELTLIDADPYLKYLPSVIAAAAFHLAGYTITGQTWPESLCKVTGYTLEHIKPCLMDLHRTYLKAAQHTQQSIREKYKSTKYHGVSLIDPPETLNLL